MKGVLAVLVVVLCWLPMAHAGAASSSADDELLALMIARIQQAESLTNEAPSQGIHELESALRDFSELAPLAARHPRALEVRALAQLALARAALALGDQALAEDTMDAAIRVARGDPIASELFGPRLEQLHRERAAALHAEGYGALEINCSAPCDVYLDERSAGTRENRLVLGTYRLWIESRDGEAAPERHHPALERSGETVVLNFPSPEPAAVPTPSRRTRAAKISAPPRAKLDPRRSIDRGPPRLLPRWLEVVGIVGGGALIGGGATLLYFDGYVVNDGHAFNGLPYGAMLVAGGTSALLTGIITLALDRKARRAGQVRRTRPSRTAVRDERPRL